MTQETITVKSAVPKHAKNGQDFKSIEAANGTKYSVWLRDSETAYNLLIPGVVAQIEVDVSDDGKYRNIKAAHKTGEAAVSAAPAAQPGFKRDTEGIAFEYERRKELAQIERQSIESQVAFKGIVDIIISGKVSDPDGKILRTALDWAARRLKDTDTK